MKQEDFLHLFLMNKQEFFHEKDLSTIKQILSQADESKQSIYSELKLFNPFFVFALSFFAGFLGIDRIYLGETLFGVFKLILSLFGIGILFALIDIYFCFQKAKTINFQRFSEIA